MNSRDSSRADALGHGPALAQTGGGMPGVHCTAMDIDKEKSTAGGVPQRAFAQVEFGGPNGFDVHAAVP
jgi:hypothetical protein